MDKIESMQENESQDVQRRIVDKQLEKSEFLGSPEMQACTEDPLDDTCRINIIQKINALRCVVSPSAKISSFLTDNVTDNFTAIRQWPVHHQSCRLALQATSRSWQNQVPKKKTPSQ